MCGITGILLSDTHRAPSEPLLWEAINHLKHRGPDAQHVFTGPGLGLAHARLSIIDISEKSDQPMIDEETGNVIVFNGEIYNYIELREILTSHGHKFRTQSDTEVILKAYNQWGIDCLNQFNGMWGFALYDIKQKKLFAARDRFGIKPFIYGISAEKNLVFASEAKAIVPLFQEFQSVNHDFLLNFVERDFFACYKETFYKNLFNLLPGHFFLASHGETPVQQRYWNWKPSINSRKMSDDDVIHEFNDLLQDSIRLRFRSDVPVGSCLSGGLDSSTIVGLSTEIYNKPLHTFSAIFSETPEFDESSYIKSSVNKFNCIARYTEPSHDDFMHLIHASVHEQDGPTGGPSILSQRAVMALAGQHVKVLLDGQGADELLGGYHGYFRYSLQSHLRGFRHRLSPASLYDFYKNMKAINKRTNQKSGKLYEYLHLVRNKANFYTSNREDTQLHYFEPFQQDDLNTLLLEHTFTNLPNLLHYEDRNSMRFSVESRLPFLDYRLVEFAFSLPHHYKIRGSTTKWMLNQVAQKILPRDVLERKDKMGFTTPAHQWFLHNDNISHFEKYMQKDNPLLSNLSPFMKEHLSRSFQTLSDAKSTTLTPATSGDINGLWRLFTANIWLEAMEG